MCFELSFASCVLKDMDLEASCKVFLAERSLLFYVILIRLLYFICVGLYTKRMLQKALLFFHDLEFYFCESKRCFISQGFWILGSRLLLMDLFLL